MSLAFFEATGKVQKVMFRQTLIRACLKRNLQCGASNDKQQKNRVTFTMSGEKQKIDEITDFMKSGKEMNDWGARCETLNQLDSGKKIEEHQVTTANVDTFDWDPNVKFYV